MMGKIKAYKGFNDKLQCRDFQYEIGKEYEEETADICECGFHACESPLDVLGYYPPGANSRYCEVELDANEQTEPDDSKRVGKHIKIGAEIGIKGLIHAHFEYVKSHVKEYIEKGDSCAATAGERGAATAGNRGAATAGDSGAATAGNRGAATAGERGAATAGDYGAATAGDRGAATAGDRGAATAGNRGAATAGDYGAATAGNRGAATAGDRGAATAGDYGAATAGDYGAATSRGKSASGKNGLSVARGNNVKVKGGMGAVLIIVEENKNNYDISAWRAAVVDGENIKADTWYCLKDGEFAEVESEE